MPSEVPTFKEAITAWLAEQIASRELRESSARVYTNILRKWAMPSLGAMPVNAITREQIGSAITAIKTAGMSAATVRAVVNPMRRFFQALVETKALAQSPAADLRFFIGRKKRQPRQPTYFTQAEVRTLLEAAREYYPRHAAFLETGLLAGLRWGESAGLYATDIEWKRCRLHVQRTVSGRSRLEPPKDRESRHVVMSPALRAALKAQCESVALEGSVRGWDGDARLHMFPRDDGRLLVYRDFIRSVWRPLLRRAGLPYRRYHSTRHSYATWLLEAGTDPRFVQQQLGHSSIAITCDIYEHMQPEKHESALVALDAIVRG
jgi:integrase